MSLIKHLLIAFGLLVLAVVAFGIFLAFEGRGFKEQHAGFIEAFMTDFSESWEVASVRYRVTDAFVREVDTPSGRQTLASFRTLGRLLRIEDLELGAYRATTEETAGLFTFRAVFEHADASVRLGLIERREDLRVNLLDITPSSEGGQRLLRIQV